MKRIIFIALFIASVFSLKAQPCISVQEDGSVLFNNLDGYEYLVINDESGVSVETIDATDFTDGTYIYTKVNANDGIVTSKVITNEPTEKSISTVFISATVEDDDITISWLSKGYSTVKYNIHRKLKAEQNYKLIHTFEEPDDYLPSDDVSFTYEDERVSGCEISYKIEREEDGCSSWSNEVTVASVDNEEPSSVEFRGIDVSEQSQRVIVNWSVNASEDTWGYVVCKKNEEGIRVTLDSVFGKNNTSYVCNSCSPTEMTDISVYAFDSCNNPSDNSPFYSNMVLSAARNSCDEPLTLSWQQHYPTLENRTFDVYAKINDGGFEKVASDLNKMKYEYEMPQTDGKVMFYVKTSTSEQSTTSFTSNIVTVSTSGADTLDYIYLNTVSIGEDNSSVTIKAEYDATKKISHLELWRRMDKEEYVKVKDLAYELSGVFETTDNVSPFASDHQYTYKVLAPDVCGSGLYSSSNELSAMLLKIDASAQPKIKLSWTPYTPGHMDVLEYGVYRFAENDADNAELIGITSAISFIDNTDNMVSATDRTYYYVKAVINPGFEGQNTGFWDANSSNGYAKFESIFFVPNAFSPRESVNERIATFKPECHFVRSGTYSFKVYNRKGEILFETADPNEGWNGKYKGEYCPVGTYVYKIQFVDSEGMEQNKGGVFMLFE